MSTPSFSPTLSPSFPPPLPPPLSLSLCNTYLDELLDVGLIQRLRLCHYLLLPYRYREGGEREGKGTNTWLHGPASTGDHAKILVTHTCMYTRTCTCIYMYAGSVYSYPSRYPRRQGISVGFHREWRWLFDPPSPILALEQQQRLLTYVCMGMAKVAGNIGKGTTIFVLKPIAHTYNF